MKSIERQDEWVCTCPVSCKEMGYEVENYQPNTCKISYMKPGTENEHTAAKVLTWFCFIASFACFVWFAYQASPGSVDFRPHCHACRRTPPLPP